MQTSFELRLRCNKGQCFAQRALFFYFQGTLAGAKCNKAHSGRYSVKTQVYDERGARIRQQSLAVSSPEHTRHLFLFPLWHSCVEKKLPIYTTEHCNNVVTLTKILNIGKLAFIVCMNLYLYCNSDKIVRGCFFFLLFFISVGVQYCLRDFLSTTKRGKQML